MFNYSKIVLTIILVDRTILHNILEIKINFCHNFCLLNYKQGKIKQKAIGKSKIIRYERQREFINGLKNLLN